MLKGKSSCVSERRERLDGHDRASIQARRNDLGRSRHLIGTDMSAYLNSGKSEVHDKTGQI
jgi:hypothetical protein